MGDAKEQFLKDQECAGRWSGFINGPDSGKVFAFADGELINHSELTNDIRRGAMLYKSILKTLCEPEEPEPVPPTSGLRHNIDPRPRLSKSAKKDEASK